MEVLMGRTMEIAVKNKGNDSETNNRNGNGNYNGNDEQTDDGKKLLAMASSATILIGSASAF